MTSELQKNAGYLLPAQIDNHDLECVQLYIPKNNEYRAAFLGALYSLTKWWVWEKSYEQNDRRATQAALYWRSLLFQHLKMDAPCSELPTGNGCADYPLSSGFISWYPLSPYTDEGQTPDGWTNPPFSFVGAGDLLLGYLEGDVIVTGFPQPDSGDLTLPSITFHLTGSGVVELHLLTVLNGGMAVVTVDGDSLNSKTFDLNADAVSFPEESNALQLVYEVSLETSGSHTVEVRFAPVLDDTFIPIRYGGGIRSVVLCGFDEMSLDVRQNPTNPCELQKTNDGTEWIPFADLSLCATPLPKSQTPLHWRVQSGQTQWSQDGITFYEFPDGQGVEFGQREPSFPEGADKACLAAKNIVSTLRTQFSQIRDGLAVSGAVLSIMALVTAIVLVFVTAGAAAPLVLAFVAEVSALGAAGILANLTDAFWDDIECIIYESIGSDGLFSSGEYAAFHEQILALGDAGTILTALTTIYGPVGLNNMVNGAGIVSCGQTPCEPVDYYQEMDFRQSPSPAKISLWTVNAGSPFDRGTVGGEWVSGVGYRAIANHNSFDGWTTKLQIEIPIVGLTIKKIQYDYYVEKVSVPAPNGVIAMSLSFDGGGSLNSPDNGVGISNGWHTSQWILSPAAIVPSGVLRIWINPEFSGNAAYHPTTGVGILQKLRIYNS